VKIKLIVLSIL